MWAECIFFPSLALASVGREKFCQQLLFSVAATISYLLIGGGNPNLSSSAAVAAAAVIVKSSKVVYNLGIISSSSHSKPDQKAS